MILVSPISLRLMSDVVNGVRFGACFISALVITEYVVTKTEINAHQNGRHSRGPTSGLVNINLARQFSIQSLK